MRCQRLFISFMRGFWFQSRLKKWPARLSRVEWFSRALAFRSLALLSVRENRDCSLSSPGLSTSWSATFWQLLVFRATFSILRNFPSYVLIEISEQLLVLKLAFFSIFHNALVENLWISCKNGAKSSSSGADQVSRVKKVIQQFYWFITFFGFIEDKVSCYFLSARGVSGNKNWTKTTTFLSSFYYPWPNVLTENNSWLTKKMAVTRYAGKQADCYCKGWFPRMRFWLRMLTHVNFKQVHKIEAIKSAELKREGERGATFTLKSDLSCIASILFAT